MSQSVSAYGLWVTAAILFGVGCLEFRLRRLHTSVLERPLVVGTCMLAAGIGGRIHYILEGVVLGWLPTSEVPALLSPLRGGSTFFGAMAGLLLALVLLRKRLPFQSVPRLLDEGVPGIGVTILLGRIGCLVQGCCPGRHSNTPWAVVPTSEVQAQAGLIGGARVHPFVIYLGLWAVAAAWLATRQTSGKRSVPRPGTRLLLFITLFSAGRILLEWFRLPPPHLLWGLNVAQWEALALTISAGILLWDGRRREIGA